MERVPRGAPLPPVRPNTEARWPDVPGALTPAELVVHPATTCIDDMATKAAAIDFSKILSSGIGKETQAQIVAFRKRADEARRALANLQNQPTSVDLSHYKSVLKVRGRACAPGLHGRTSRWSRRLKRS